VAVPSAGDPGDRAAAVSAARWIFEVNPPRERHDIAGGNRPMDAEDGRKIKDTYRETWQTTRETGFGFPCHGADRTALSVTDEEWQRIYSEAWERGGRGGPGRCVVESD
jgi:hypothetical protein